MNTRWLSAGNRQVWPSVVDVVVSVMAMLFGIGSYLRLGLGLSGVAVFGFGAAGAVAVLFRRRWPVPVLLTTLAILIVAVTVQQANPGLLAFTEVALFTVANQTDRRTTVVAGISTAAALYVGAILQSRVGWDQGATLGILAWTGLFAAAGDATRNRRSYVMAVEERARKAESERDAEAARQVAEERLRIARELHDVLAHHIAVIHVHAGLADATLTTSPETSKQSLGYIRQAAADVLSEMSALIPVLRSADERASTAPQAPAPGLDRLDELIDSYQRSGAPIRFRVSGKPHPLPSAIDLAAYRVIQEALTNAGKHGVPGTTELGIDYAADRFNVRVTNRVADTENAVIGTGLGIIGMRERAASVGAELTTGQQQDIFVVEVGLDLAARTP